jgi:hypothetical protein
MTIELSSKVQLAIPGTIEQIFNLTGQLQTDH